jgi:YidC/Oxa1 family membrane protein insertase
MKNNVNVIIAIVLSFIVIAGWQHFIMGPRLEAERLAAEQRAAQQTAQQVAAGQPAPAATTQPGAQPGAPAIPGAPAAPAVPGAPAIPGAAPVLPAGTAAAPAAREQVIAASDRVAIDTPSLKGSIDLRGGRIDDLLLARYHVTVEPTSPLVSLFSPLGTANPYYAEFGWVAPAGGPAVPGPDTVWTADGRTLAPGQDVTLSWDNGAGLVFHRTYSVDPDYMFAVRQSVENRTAVPVTLFPYGLVSRTGLPQTSGYYILHEGLIGYLGDEGLQEVDYDDLDEVPALTPTKTASGWLGITDKYWGAALVPASGQPFQPRFLKGAAGAQPTYQADFLGDPVTVAAGATGENLTRLFAGAKQVSLLDHYEAELKVPRFELMIDWGWFYFITKPLFQVIDYLYRVLGNFGLAILAVTVIVKLIFFPLANRSYQSMSRMKKLQPEVVKLQERFKDDRVALQQAMMALYKQEKINPVAGCWPILIQIPVFFSLYKVLFVTIEMRHAPFFGWIRDLSAPDPTNLFTLFGLIPWDPPQLLHLGIWPLIMGVTMFVQMRMNPTPPDKTQAMIFNWMPVIFTFMLGSFPAGLVIYWAWNNTLSVLQQGYIMRRNGVPIELWGNLRGLLGRKQSTPAE